MEEKSRGSACDLCSAADVAAYGGVPRVPVIRVHYTWRRRGARKFSAEAQGMSLCYGCAMQYGVIDVLPGQILKVGSGDMFITKIIRLASTSPPQTQGAPPLAAAPPTATMEDMMDEMYGRW